MAYTTENNYTGNGSTRLFSFTFPYLEDTDVKVSLNQVATTNFTLANATQIQFTADAGGETSTQAADGAPKNAVKVKVYRDTNIDNLQSEFFSGSAVRAQDLNNDFNQTLYVCQETEKAVEGKWNNTTQTIDSTESFVDSNDYIMTAAAIDDRIVANIAAPALANGKIWAGNGSGVGAQVTPSGDVTMANTGAFTIANSAVETAMIAGNAITSGLIGADQVDSQHYAADSIDTEHYAPGSVDTTAIADGTITNTDINGNAGIAHSKLASLTDGRILVGNGSNVPVGVTVSGDVTLANDGAVTIASGAVETGMIAAGAINNNKLDINCVATGNIIQGTIENADINDDAAIAFTKLEDLDSAKILVGNASNEATEVTVSGDVTIANTGAVTIADDAVGADQLASNAVVNASVASGAAIEHAKLAAVTSGNVIVGNGSNQAASVAMSGDVAIAAGGATTIQANAVEIGMIGCEQTTITDSDSHIPTSGAVVDYVAAQIAPIGGLEVIADDESFPNTIPNAGVVISIADCAGLSVNSSGVSTNADTLDNSTVTINGFPSELRGGVGGNADPYVFASGAGLMVKSTGSSQTYDYHQALIREADFVSLSDDINDFNNRYRIGTRTANNSNTNDDGDLFFDTGTNKMYVYDGAYDSGGSWKEVTSAGDYKLLTIKDNGQAHDGNLNLNGVNDQFDLFDGTSDASITSAGQLIVVLNGVVQKPNASYDASGEGFALDGSDGIRFCDPPPNNSVCFVTQIGTATTINDPADNSVSQAKIQNGAVDTAQLAADAVDGTRIEDAAVNSEHIATGAIDHVHLATDIIDGDNLADNAVDSEHYTDGSIDNEHLADNAVDLAEMAHGTQGDVLYYGSGGAPARLGAGTNGYYLKTQGGSANPVWAEVSGGVTSDAQNNTTGGDAAGNALDGDTIGNTLFGENAGTAINSGDYNNCFGYEAGKALTSGNYNIAVGFEALKSSTTGGSNIAIGHKAINGADVTGASNIAIGTEALKAATGNFNGQIGIGYRAGYQTTADGGQTAIGFESCMSNVTGIRNTGIGYKALRLTTGGMNTALGYLAGVSIGGASNNTMIGHEAGQATNIGASNTFVGYNAAYLTTEGNENVAVGNTAMYQNATGDENTAIGGRAMYGSGSNNESFKNVCVGYESGEDLTTGSYNTFIGAQAAHEATTSNNNVAIGINAGGTLTTGANNIFIGHESGYNQVDTGDNTFWIARGGTGHGATAVWLSGDSSGNVYRTGGGTAFTSTSDERIKKNITDNNEGLSLIKQLRVKNFEWKTEEEIDRTAFGGSADDAKYTKEEAAKLGSVSEGEYKKRYGLDIPGTHVGLIAQELEAVKAKWVNTTKEGKKTIDPSELTWVLVNAVKELSTKNDALEARIATLEAK
jgi:hypothetical protein